MPRPSRTGTRGLYKDADGRYSFDLRWRDPVTGEYRRYRERFAEGIVSAAAKNRAREILAGALSGRVDPTKRNTPRRLQDALGEYAEFCKANTPGRDKKRRAACRRLVAIIGDKSLDDMGALDVERFKRDRQGGSGRPVDDPLKDLRPEEVGPATVNRDIEVLKHFCGLAASWGWMKREIADSIRRVKRLKEPPGRTRHLKSEEEAKLLGELPVQVRRIVLTAVLTGMRQEEVVRLKKSAVDLKARQLTLTKTKSNKVRPVYLNNAALAVVKEAMKASPNEYVFANRAGTPYTCDGVRSIFRRARERSGVTDFRFHDLRHTTATRLRRAGAGLDVVADVLGQATLAMAQRYAHLGKETMQAAMAALPPPASPAPPSPRRRRAGGDKEAGSTRRRRSVLAAESESALIDERARAFGRLAPIFSNDASSATSAPLPQRAAPACAFKRLKQSAASTDEVDAQR